MRFLCFPNLYLFKGICQNFFTIFIKTDKYDRNIIKEYITRKESTHI